MVIRILVLLSLLAWPTVPAQTNVPLTALTWRNVGPAVTGTRIVELAVVERDPRTFYAATASSGVWKTGNAGTTWSPVFERAGRISIGGMAVAPSNPDILWVATGEPNMRNLRSTSPGDGIYRSEDGGRSWQHRGLRNSQHMGRVVVHPTNPDIVYASAVGSMWDSNNEARGLWKTTDGGSTWRNVLAPGGRTGVVDIAMDPRNASVLYAAAWHRERRDWSFISTGTGSGVYKSTDAGETWTRLAAGLPAGPMGRIGLSVCRSQPATVFAAVEGDAATRGIYRSTDAGATWTRRAPISASSYYYGQIRCDPGDPQRVHVLQTEIATSSDGGATFRTELPGPGVHVDHHDLWTNPSNREHLILGNDGGVYQSYDAGRSWRHMSQMVTTQFYTVATDMREPFYYVYGGTQDNNSLGGPSATRNSDGIVNDDWYVTVGGDGFSVQVEPANPNVVYTESQYGGLVRFNPSTGERRRIVPQAPAGTTYRWNWNAPIHISVHDGSTVYFGSQFLHRSRTRGDSWETVSPDLTKQVAIDPANRISDYGTLRFIHESPRRAGLIAVATDDGLVQVTEDGGVTWRKIETFPGVPIGTQIVRVFFSAHDDKVMYVVPAGHEDDDFEPYLLRSADLGMTWTSVAGDLPQDSPVLSFVEDPSNAKLLFAGTYTGVFGSLDAGQTWRPVAAGLPTVPVHDMVIHPRERDLVIGSHGRGIWILDSIRGLEALTGDAPSSSAVVVAARPGTQWTRFQRGRDAIGQTYFRAPNPEDGVYIDYRLFTGAGDGRLTIHNAAGELVRTLPVPADPGVTLRRVVWDMRGAAVAGGGRGAGAGGAPGGGRGGGRGALVAPGTYQARLTVGGQTVTTTVEVRADPGR